MAKTINPDIDIFSKIELAKRAFNKMNKGCLLQSRDGYFTDKKNSVDPESAYANWPKLYTILEEKYDHIDLIDKDKTKNYE